MSSPSWPRLDVEELVNEGGMPASVFFIGANEIA
jgi:hypothetical protein